MIPDEDAQQTRQWAQQRVPEAVRDKVRIEAVVEDRSTTIVESRPPWRGDSDDDWTRQPVAQMRYTNSRKQWTLYWIDSGMRWRRYDQVAPAEGIRPLLDAVEADEHALFWG